MTREQFIVFCQDRFNFTPEENLLATFDKFRYIHIEHYGKIEIDDGLLCRFVLANTNIPKEEKT
jgi:hypothetical protein